MKGYRDEMGDGTNHELVGSIRLVYRRAMQCMESEARACNLSASKTFCARGLMRRFDEHRLVPAQRRVSAGFCRGR